MKFQTWRKKTDASGARGMARATEEQLCGSRESEEVAGGGGDN